MRERLTSIVKNPAELVAVGVAAAFLVGAALAADLGQTAEDADGFGSVAQEPSQRRDLVTAYVGGRASARTIPPSGEPTPGVTAPPSDVVQWPGVGQPQLSPWITVSDPENTTAPASGSGTRTVQSPTPSGQSSATSPSSPATPAPTPSTTPAPDVTPTPAPTETSETQPAPPTTTEPAPPTTTEPAPTGTSSPDSTDSSAPNEQGPTADAAPGQQTHLPAMAAPRADQGAPPPADPEPVPESSLD